MGVASQTVGPIAKEDEIKKRFEVGIYETENLYVDAYNPKK